MSTPHNGAEMGAIAKTVLMPGDPLRAKMIAEKYLDNVVQFNDVRNMLGYTGTYKGKPVSVMGSGMGMPSIGIYSYELYKFYGVETIIRLGSAGAVTEKLNVYDTILATGAYSDSSYAFNQSGDEEKVQKPDAALCAALEKTADKMNIALTKGTILSSDVFYFEESQFPALFGKIAQYELLASEMESFALFHNAKILGKKAACLLTVSDNIITHADTTAEERQNHLLNMIEIALETIAAE